MKWEKVKLGEIALCITKGTTPSNVGDTFVKQGIKYIRSELISSSRRISDEGLLYISELTHQKLSRSQLQENDILFSIAGVYLGKTALLRKTDIPANTNQAVGIIRLDNKKCCINYIYYYLNLRSVVNYINRLSSQAAQPNINLTQLSNISIFLPPLPIQERIADILSAYDDLIENNQKQIKLLEEAAQRLYKEWFVDFRFPGHETTPIVDGIPEGWEKKPAEVFFNITIGKTPPRAESKWFSDRREDIPWASISDMGQSGVYLTDTSEYLTREAVDVFNISTAPTGSVLLSFKLTVGRVRINSVPMCTNEAIAHFHIDDPVLRQYTFHYLSNFNYEELGNTSSISKAINSKKIKMMPFIMPTRNILEKYYHVANPIFESILVKQQEIASLKEARDRLLPKLMNGEIDVMEKAKKEMPSDRFDHIRRHWENVPYDPNQFALAARADGQLTEEEVKKLKDIAEEE